MVVPFSRIYAAFAAGYLMSYLFRTVNAVISPELTRELGLSAGALGLLTSTYFVAFASMQIPAGMLLDRYGPRRIEPVLLVVAAIGTFAFAAADGLMTNFHMPKSTLMILVAAFMGLDRIRAVYAHALANGYRFLSYGDASLLLPGERP